MTDEPQEPGQSSWEDEGGALAPERKQKQETSKRSEISASKRGVVAALRKLVRPYKKS
jgi:hypothetical protein